MCLHVLINWRWLYLLLLKKNRSKERGNTSVLHGLEDSFGIMYLVLVASDRYT